MKTVFKKNMTGLEVARKIVLEDPRIEYLLFHKYAENKHSGKYPPETPISRLLYNDDLTSRKVIRAKREDILKNKNCYKLFFEYDKKSTSVLSVVKIGEEAFHIPMMDFLCHRSEENIKRIKEFLRYVGQKQGAILDSGASYHYYGLSLMKKREWLQFMGKCLLFDDFVDKRYVGHCLITGCSVLRVSGNFPPTRDTPKVVATINMKAD